jgi:sugar phosphate isomerase/epimerase
MGMARTVAVVCVARSACEVSVLGLKIALETRCLAQPLKQALLTAGRLGYEGVGIDARREVAPAELSDTGLRQLRKMLNDLNLRVATVAFPTRRGYAEPDDLDRRIAATLDAMRLASRLGAGVLLVAPGPLPADQTAERAMLVDALTALAAQGGRLGVLPTLQCPDAELAELARLASTLPQGLTGVDLNPAELIQHGQSPREFVAALGSHIAHVFANDAVRSLGGGAVEVALGRGSADFPELLGNLEEFDYRGWVTVERRSSTRTVEDVADAIAFLRAL